MLELDDSVLLKEYVEHSSEEAFATLVARHVNKVYSIALRHTRNAHQAEEITQAVFVLLARKSRQLGKRVILSGWLCRTARLSAVTFVRSEIRRTRREQEAHMQNLLNESESEVWPQISPFLDVAMAGLSESDQDAVALRFFDGKSMREIGAALGVSEDATKMRVNRAVEKLRIFFTRRGIVCSAAALTAAISANSVHAAPIGLAVTISTVAAHAGITLTTTATATATKAIAMTTAQKALIAIALAVAVGTGIYEIWKTSAAKPEATPAAAVILDANSEVESIRSFLSNPHPLAYYLYQYTNNEVDPETGTLMGTLLFRGGWKNESVNWSQQLFTSTNVSPEVALGFSCGRMNDLLWEAHSGHLTTARGDSNPKRKAALLSQAHAAHLRACMILHLGLQEVDFSKASWNGLSFEATATRSRFAPTQVSRRVHGQIAQRGPKHFEIAVTNRATGEFESKVSLRYHGEVSASSFPESMEILQRIKLRDSSVREKITHVRILEVQTGSKDLAEEQFAPGGIKGIEIRSASFYSNDVAYGISPSRFSTEPARIYRMLTTEENGRRSPAK